MNNTLKLVSLAAAVATIVAAGAAQASSVTLPLGTGSNLYTGGYTLTTGADIENYFNGGNDSQVAKDGTGPALGFTFSGNATAQKAGTSPTTGDGRFENNPSQASEILSFSSSSSTAAYMNYLPGFSNLSFNYSYSNNNPGATDLDAYVYSGLNGTGTLLDTLKLTPGGTAVSCKTAGDSYCTWSTAAISWGGAAESVVFGTTAGATTTATPAIITEFDGVTVTPVPLPAALWLMLGGFGGLAAFVRRRTA
jgi:hypothetical protein